MEFRMCNKSFSCIILMMALLISMIPSQIQAFTLHDVRNTFRQHRFLIVALISAGIVYGFSHKIIKKIINDYQKQQKEQSDMDSSHVNNSQKSKIDYFETIADIFIKSTKVIGTIFKVIRAATCPADGKSTGDQWLDDFSQLA